MAKWNKGKKPCPVCGTLLSKSAFEKALRIHMAREKHLGELQDELERRQDGMDDEVASAEHRGQKKEKQRCERLMAGQKKVIGKLQERIVQLEKGTTPQTDGLEFEGK